MANEILLLTRQKLGRRRERIDLLYLAPLSPLIRNGVGAIVVPTPSPGLSEQVTDQGLLTGPELVALDAGGSFFLETSVVRQPRETDVELVTRVREHYAVTVQEAIRDLRNRFVVMGVRVNA